MGRDLRGRYRGTSRLVSILVLLEWPYEVSPHEIIASIMMMFQSLLYWNDLMRSMYHPWEALKVTCFNPCCIGMTLWGWGTPEDQRLCYHVSILVVLEWPYEGSLGDKPAMHQLLFQSLLYWNDLMRSMYHPWEALKVTCFNPCCIGMTLWGEQQKPVIAQMTLFQSLLYWNDLMRESYGFGHCWGGFRVSILVVLEWPYEVHIESRIGDFLLGFNPCCIGMTLWGQWCRRLGL